MSHQLISRSTDLKKLRDEGYDIAIRSGHLIVRQVPYVNSGKKICFGTLISKLTLAGDITAKPDDHVAFFEGEYPCHVDGTAIEQFRSGTERYNLGQDLCASHRFSAKPISGGYANYYDKITNYEAILSGPAQDIDPSVTAKTFPVIEAKEDESVFNYIDTASSRAGINVVTNKLELGRVAIVGLGGTGSYILDLIVKTPVKKIHLFDGDKFLQHNAFRSPGAASSEELQEKLAKTTYFERIYSKMRKGICGHPYFIDASNVDQLRDMNFVFLCLDSGEARQRIVEKLEEFSIRFIDVGMGVEESNGSLCGILRISTSTPEKREHVWVNKRIPFSEDGGNNEYNLNIQIADLNALNAALAVIKWKKMFGFYHDLEKEHFSAYTIDGNDLMNEEKS